MAAKVFLFVTLIAVITVEEGWKIQIRRREQKKYKKEIKTKNTSRNTNHKYKIQACIISSMAAKVFLFVTLIAVITVEEGWKMQKMK